MTKADDVKQLLAGMSETERRQVLAHLREGLPKHPMEDLLMTSAEALLEALSRAGDFTVRMIRGVVAEGVFAADVLPTLPNGWREIPTSGDRPYDFLLTDVPEGAPTPTRHPHVRVQVKMQRSEGKKPLYASEQWKTRVKWPSGYYIVEVQKSRKGEKKGKSTRPYRFGEFDILAVSLGPARGRWSAFMYTLERWLLPNPSEITEILTFQPVAPTDSESWTSDFTKAVGWLRSDVKKRIEGDLPKAGGRRAKRGRKRQR